MSPVNAYFEPADDHGYRFSRVIATGGIGSGMVFHLEGDHTLGRNESRPGKLMPYKDYCKLHIITHYVSVLLGAASANEIELKKYRRLYAMLKLFEYNWQVRKDWFDWCESVDEKELLKKRTGGPGSILYTLFHIVDVEYAWVSGLQGKEPQLPPFEDCASVQKVRDFSARCHAEIAPFIYAWNSGMETRVLSDQDETGEWESFKYGEIMRHVLAHEIHHIGQLSVWSREIGKQPITANLIRRGLFDI